MGFLQNKYILTALFIFIIFMSMTAGHGTVYASTATTKAVFGGDGNDAFSGVSPTSDGGYVAVGLSNPSTTGDLIGQYKDITAVYYSDAIIVKYNSSNVLEWKKTFGGANPDAFSSVSQTSDGGYIAAGYSEYSTTGDFVGEYKGLDKDAILVKYDSLGNVVWKKIFGGSGRDVFNSVIVTSDGGYIAAGQSYYSTTGDLAGLYKSNSSNDAVLVKYSSTGVIEWVKVFGGTGDDSFQSVIKTSDGNYIVAGLAGYSTTGDLAGLFKDTVGDAILIKYDPSGNILWKKLFGGTSADGFLSVSQTSDGGYLAGGLSNYSTGGDLVGLYKGTSFDGITVKYDSTGTVVWARVFGGSGIEYLNSVTESLDGNYICVGYSGYSATGNLAGLYRGAGSDEDAFIVKYDTSGNILSQEVFGGDGKDTFNAVTTLNDGRIAAVGRSVSSTVGDLTGMYKGGGDAMIATYPFVSSIIISIIPSSLTPTNQDIVASVNIIAGGRSAVSKWAVGDQPISYFSSAGTTIIGPSFSIPTNGTYTVYAKDSIGNEAVKTIVISNIDKTPPTSPLLSSDTSTPTNGSVTVSINYSVDSVIKEYQVNGGNWVAYTTPIVLTSNKTINARGIDAAGNISSLGTLVVSNINPAIPILVADNTIPTSTKVTITYQVDMVSKEYRINGGDWISYTAPIVMVVNGTIDARGTDTVGITSGLGTLVITSIIPTTPVLMPDKVNPTNTNVIITIIYQDNMMSKEYRINGESWIAYTAPIVVSNNNSIEARQSDALGNVSDIGIYVVSNIDKIAPPAPSIVPSSSLPTNQNITINITYSTDSISKEYRINNAMWQDYTGSIIATENEIIDARAIDAAGNISTIATYIISNIDKEAPRTPTLSANITTPTNQFVIVTIDYSADSATRLYRVLPSSEWLNYTGPFNVNDNAIVEASAIDQVGNISSIGTYSINNIDKIPPAIPILVSNNLSPTNQNIIVTINYSLDSVIKEYRINGGMWKIYTVPVVVTENGTLDARSMDAAGNMSTSGTISITNIDRVAPTPPTNPRIVNNNLIWTASTDNVSVSGYNIYNGNVLIGTVIGSTTSFVLTYVNYNITIKAIDSAGNISVASNAVKSFQYIYDSRGRIDYIQITSDKILKYTYDSNGNLLNVHLQ